MRKPKQQQLANRARRIPRRVREIQAEIKSLDGRAVEIENADFLPETREGLIRKLRQSYGPLHAQLRALMDRGSELGLRIAA